MSHIRLINSFTIIFLAILLVNIGPFVYDCKIIGYFEY